MEKSYFSALRAIRSGGKARIFVLHQCQDGYAADWLASALAGRAAPPSPCSPPDGAVQRASLSGRSLAGALAAACGESLLDSPDVILYSGFDHLTAKRRGGVSDGDAAALERLLQDPPSIPIVLTDAGKMDERKKLSKLFLQSADAVVVNFAKHGRGEWGNLARELLAGASLTRAQEERLQARSGQSLGMLAAEVEKLKLYADGATLSDEEFDSLAADVSVPDPFAAVRLTVARRWPEAYEAFRNLPEADSTFAFAGLLARQYRLILRVHELGGGLSDPQLAAAAGVHPYALKVAREQAAGLTRRECSEALSQLAEIDYGIKSGAVSEKLALDLWYLRHLAQ